MKITSKTNLKITLQTKLKLRPAFYGASNIISIKRSSLFWDLKRVIITPTDGLKTTRLKVFRMVHFVTFQNLMNCKYPSNQVKSSSLLKLLVLFFIKYVADDCIVSNTLLIYALQRLGERKKNTCAW